MIVLGSDHGGLLLKEAVKKLFLERGIKYEDCGTDNGSSVDYPDFGEKVARRVSTGAAEKGVLFCGTGIGMSMVANRFPGVRATLCHDLYTARMSREHNDSNVLVLGGRLLGKGIAREILGIWLEAEFLEGNHRRRLDQIARLDDKKRESSGARRK